MNNLFGWKRSAHLHLPGCFHLAKKLQHSFAEHYRLEMAVSQQPKSVGIAVGFTDVTRLRFENNLNYTFFSGRALT